LTYNPDEVIKKYDRAIHKVANLYFFDSPRFSYEDLVDEAKVAAIEACSSYVDGGQATFFTFLTSSMNRRVQKYVKSNRYDIKVTEYKQRKEFKESGNCNKIADVAEAVRIDKNSEDSKNNGIGSLTIPSGQLPPYVSLIRSESLGILMEELDSLPDREKTVISERWLEGKTLEEIAGDFGVTKQTIHGWSKQGFERLQRRVKLRLGEELVF
jgi:RNA polymerase sigma factor (sigma-70 family)